MSLTPSNFKTKRRPRLASSKKTTAGAASRTTSSRAWSAMLAKSTTLYQLKISIPSTHPRRSSFGLFHFKGAMCHETNSIGVAWANRICCWYWSPNDQLNWLDCAKMTCGHTAITGDLQVNSYNRSHWFWHTCALQPFFLYPKTSYLGPKNHWVRWKDLPTGGHTKPRRSLHPSLRLPIKLGHHVAGANWESFGTTGGTWTGVVQGTSKTMVVNMNQEAWWFDLARP